MGFRRPAGSAWFLISAVVLAWTTSVAALDQPISGRVLKIKRTASGDTRMVFLSRDASFLFPPIGGADDPATGSPGGITVDVFTQSEPPASWSAPPGVGNPGWTAVDGAVDRYLYRGTGVPFRKVLLREGRVLQVRREGLGLDLDGPLGAVAIRVTTGTLRSCAVFGAGTVLRDDPGSFSARNAPAPPIADCSDASLTGALGPSCVAAGDWPTCGGPCPEDGVCAPRLDGTCICAFPTQGCGATAPVCNGECGAGEECVAIEDGLPGAGGLCTCTPVGVTPCGAAGAPSCGGACDAGDACVSVTNTHGTFCTCATAGADCGPLPGECPLDFQCTFLGPTTGYACVPTTCGGTFPTCGGVCSGGRDCVPLEVAGTGMCVCATPGFSCDDPACGGGLTCPSGEICTVDLSGGGPTCSCEAP
jgi:hypothetical protein